MVRFLRDGPIYYVCSSLCNFDRSVSETCLATEHHPLRIPKGNGGEHSPDKYVEVDEPCKDAWHPWVLEAPFPITFLFKRPGLLCWYTGLHQY